jgi:hypothetical protein
VCRCEKIAIIFFLVLLLGSDTVTRLIVNFAARVRGPDRNLADNLVCLTVELGHLIIVIVVLVSTWPIVTAHNVAEATLVADITLVHCWELEILVLDQHGASELLRVKVELELLKVLLLVFLEPVFASLQADVDCWPHDSVESDHCVAFRRFRIPRICKMEHKMAFCFKPNCIACVLSVSWEDSVSTRFLAIEVESESLMLDRTRCIKLQGQVRHNAISFSN